MDNPIFMEVLKPNDNVGHKKLSLLLSEGSTIAQMITKITPVKVVHYQEEILPILESILDID